MPYERPKNLDNNKSDKFLRATIALLCNLFSESKYSSDDKLLFDCICFNGIENYISGEIFSEGAIRISPQSNLSQDKKIFYQLVLAYVLHCRLNYKLERCQYELCTFETFDNYLYEILCYAAWENCQHWEERNKDLCGVRSFFDNMLHTSFRFISPYGAEYIWRGSKYSPVNNKCHRFEIEADFDYGSYLRFLLTKYGNPLHYDFGDSTRSFWDNIVKLRLRRSNSPHRLEDGPTAEIDLIIFCLALGLEEKTLNRLIFLRDKAYTDRRPTRPTTPHFANPQQEQQVKNRLREFLRGDANQRLARARANQPLIHVIPHQMLLDVNNDLAQSNLPTLF